MSIFKDIMTIANGESYDVSRVVMTINALMLIPTLILGEAMYVFTFSYNKPFSIQDFFTAVLTFEGGVSALLVGGAASIWIKKTTEADGTITQTESIQKGTQPDTIVNVTNTKHF